MTAERSCKRQTTSLLKTRRYLHGAQQLTLFHSLIRAGLPLCDLRDIFEHSLRSFFPFHVSQDGGVTFFGCRPCLPYLVAWQRRQQQPPTFSHFALCTPDTLCPHFGFHNALQFSYSSIRQADCAANHYPTPSQLHSNTSITLNAWTGALCHYTKHQAHTTLTFAQSALLANVPTIIIIMAASDMMPPMVVSTNRFADLQPYTSRLYDANPDVWGAIFPWDFPQYASQAREELFIRQWFDEQEIHAQGGAYPPGAGFCFLKQVWYCIAFWNLEHRLPLVNQWWWDNSDRAALLSDPDMQQYFFRNDVGLSTFFDEDFINLYGENFCKNLIPSIQKTAGLRIAEAKAVMTPVAAVQGGETHRPFTKEAVKVGGTTKLALPAESAVMSSPESAELSNGLETPDAAKERAEACAENMFGAETTPTQIKGGQSRISSELQSFGRAQAYNIETERPHDRSHAPWHQPVPFNPTEIQPAHPHLFSRVPDPRITLADRYNNLSGNHFGLAPSVHGGHAQHPESGPRSLPGPHAYNMVDPTGGYQGVPGPTATHVQSTHPVFYAAAPSYGPGHNDMYPASAASMEPPRDGFHSPQRANRRNSYGSRGGKKRSSRSTRGKGGRARKSSGAVDQLQSLFSNHEAKQIATNGSASMSRAPHEYLDGRPAMVPGEHGSVDPQEQHPQSTLKENVPQTRMDRWSTSSRTLSSHPGIPTKQCYPVHSTSNTAPIHSQAGDTQYVGSDNTETLSQCGPNWIGPDCNYAITLAVFSVPPNLAEKQISRFFTNFGQVARVRRLTKRGATAAYHPLVFVDFSSCADARQCLSQRPATWLDNQPLRIEVARWHWEDSHFSQGCSPTPAPTAQESDLPQPSAVLMHHPPGDSKDQSRDDLDDTCKIVGKTAQDAGDANLADKRPTPSGFSAPKTQNSVKNKSNEKQKHKTEGHVKIASAANESQIPERTTLTETPSTEPKKPLPASAEARSTPESTTPPAETPVFPPIDSETTETWATSTVAEAQSVSEKPAVTDELKKEEYDKEQGDENASTVHGDRGAEQNGTAANETATQRREVGKSLHELDEDQADASFHTPTGHHESPTDVAFSKQCSSIAPMESEQKSNTASPSEKRSKPMQDFDGHSALLQADPQKCQEQSSFSPQNTAEEVASEATKHQAPVPKEESTKVTGPTVCQPGDMNQIKKGVEKPGSASVTPPRPGSAILEKSEKSKGPSQTESFSLFGKKKEKRPKSKKGSIRGKPKGNEKGGSALTSGATSRVASENVVPALLDEEESTSAIATGANVRHAVKKLKGKRGVGKDVESTSRPQTEPPSTSTAAVGPDSNYAEEAPKKHKGGTLETILGIFGSGQKSSSVASVEPTDPAALDDNSLTDGQDQNHAAEAETQKSSENDDSNDNTIALDADAGDLSSRPLQDPGPDEQHDTGSTAIEGGPLSHDIIDTQPAFWGNGTRSDEGLCEQMLVQEGKGGAEVKQTDGMKGDEDTTDNELAKFDFIESDWSSQASMHSEQLGAAATRGTEADFFAAAKEAIDAEAGSYGVSQKNARHLGRFPPKDPDSGHLLKGKQPRYIARKKVRRHEVRITKFDRSSFTDTDKQQAIDRCSSPSERSNVTQDDSDKVFVYAVGDGREDREIVIRGTDGIEDLPRQNVLGTERLSLAKCERITVLYL